MWRAWGQGGLPHLVGQEGTWGARKELKLITRSGRVAERNPLHPGGDLAPSAVACPPSAQMTSLMGLGGPWWPHSSFPVLFPAALWFLGFLGCSSEQSFCPSGEQGQCHWPLASCCLLPWLGCDSLHPRFLPQRARGTDPVSSRRNEGESDPRGGGCEEMQGAWRLWLPWSLCGGKPHAVRQCRPPESAGLLSEPWPLPLAPGPTQDGFFLGQGRVVPALQRPPTGGRKKWGV